MGRRNLGAADALHPMWGAGLTCLLDSGTAVSLRAVAAGKRKDLAKAIVDGTIVVDDEKWKAATKSNLAWLRAAEWAGLGLGLAAGGALAIFPRTRDAGFTGLAAAFAAGFPRALEVAFIPKEEQGAALLGMVMPEGRTGLRGRAVRVSELGAVGVERRTGLQAPGVRLVGAGAAAPGGGGYGPLPRIMGSGAHYGTTGMGHRYAGRAA